MARIAGTGGKVWVDIDDSGGFENTAGDYEWILGVTKWSLTDEADLIETTGMDSAAKATYIAGVTRFSGSITALYDSDTDYVTCPEITPGSVLNVKLEGVAGSQPAYTGDVVVKSCDPEVGIDGAVTYTISVQGTGTLTRPS